MQPNYGTGNGQYQVSAIGSGITIGIPSTSGNRRVYGVASNMTLDNATIVFTIAGKTAGGVSFSLTKTQSFAKSRTGADGESSYTVLLSNGNHTFAGTETTALAGSTKHSDTRL